MIKAGPPPEVLRDVTVIVWQLKYYHQSSGSAVWRWHHCFCGQNKWNLTKTKERFEESQHLSTEFSLLVCTVRVINVSPRRWLWQLNMSSFFAFEVIERFKLIMLIHRTEKNDFVSWEHDWRFGLSWGPIVGLFPDSWSTSPLQSYLCLILFLYFNFLNLFL